MDQEAEIAEKLELDKKTINDKLNLLGECEEQGEKFSEFMSYGMVARTVHGCRVS